MNITEFLQHSSGKWFSQRTSHHFVAKQSSSDKSDLQIDLLPKDSDEVIQLCESHKIDPSLALCGARVTWNSTKEWDSKKQSGSTILVPIASLDNDNEGDVLGLRGADKKLVIGRYEMASDDTLTLIAEYETQSGVVSSEERIWFTSPNFRLRTSTVKGADGFSMASFYSEIRMKGVQPPSQSTPATETPTTETPAPQP
jgi:CpeS-like protein